MPLHGARARVCRPEGEGWERGLACKGQAEAVSVAAVILYGGSDCLIVYLVRFPVSTPYFKPYGVVSVKVLF